MTKIILSLIITLALLASAGAAYAAASPEPSDKTIKREIKIGRKSAAEIEKHVPRVLNPSVEAKLSMIASRLIPYMQRDLDYEVRILEMEQPNAFSLPGGMTYITTGMLDFLKSEDEIAAGTCSVKDLRTGVQETVTPEEAAEKIQAGIEVFNQGKVIVE